MNKQVRNNNFRCISDNKKILGQVRNGAVVRKGFSMMEMVISFALLSVIMLGASSFSSQFFEVSATSSKQLVNVNEAREISQNISDEISKATYIYPAGIALSLSSSDNGYGQAWSATINTDNSVALLFPEGEGADAIYGFSAYFIQNDGNGNPALYQYTSAPDNEWELNTSPAENMTSYSGGSVTKLVSDIDNLNTQLAFIMNYGNGVTDDILKGELAGFTSNDANALIKGIDWAIAQNNVENHIINIKGLARNVPRFIE